MNLASRTRRSAEPCGKRWPTPRKPRDGPGDGRRRTSCRRDRATPRERGARLSRSARSDAHAGACRGTNGGEPIARRANGERSAFRRRDQRFRGCPFGRPKGRPHERALRQRRAWRASLRNQARGRPDGHPGPKWSLSDPFRRMYIGRVKRPLYLISKRIESTGLSVKAELSARYSATGRVNLKTVPPPSTESNQMRPRCASTIVLQMDNPTPMPLCFEVMNGWNRLAATTGSSPDPVSATLTVTRS